MTSLVASDRVHNLKAKTSHEQLMHLQLQGLWWWKHLPDVHHSASLQNLLLSNYQTIILTWLTQFLTELEKGYRSKIVFPLKVAKVKLFFTHLIHELVSEIWNYRVQFENRSKGQNPSWKNDYQSKDPQLVFCYEARESLPFVMPRLLFQKQMEGVQGVMVCPHTGARCMVTFRHAIINTATHKDFIIIKTIPISFSLENDSWHHG